MKLTVSSDVEFAAISLDDTSDLPVLYPPSLLRYEGKLEVLGHHGDETHPIFTKFSTGSIYQDGALFETDFEPTEDPETLYDQYLMAKEALDRLLRPLGLKSWVKPAAKFDISMVKDLPADWVLSACIAGCSPDEDMIDSAYNSGEVRDLTEWPVRGLGAHLHISIPSKYGDILHEIKKPVVRMLAVTVGNMGIYTSNSIDLEKLRREKFGSPGRCRFPSYPNGKKGVEYRPLSPTWFKSLDTVSMIVEAAEYAIELAVEFPEETEELLSHYLEPTVTAINKVLPKLSEKILKDLQII